jgi:hypothetical protein
VDYRHTCESGRPQVSKLQSQTQPDGRSGVQGRSSISAPPVLDVDHETMIPHGRVLVPRLPHHTG